MDSISMQIQLGRGGGFKVRDDDAQGLKSGTGTSHVPPLVQIHAIVLYVADPTQLKYLYGSSMPRW